MNGDTPSAQAPTAHDMLEETPVFALKTVLYPEGELPLRIFEPRYLDMVSDRLRRDAPFIVALIRDGSETGRATTHSIATLARIVDWNRQSDGLLGITALGGRRVRILDTATRPDGLCVATARMLAEEPALAPPRQYHGLVELLRHHLVRIEPLYRHGTPRFDDASWVGYRMSELLPIPLARKQHFLEIEAPLLRLRELSALVGILSESNPG